MKSGKNLTIHPFSFQFLSNELDKNEPWPEKVEKKIFDHKKEVQNGLYT